MKTVNAHPLTAVKYLKPLLFVLLLPLARRLYESVTRRALSPIFLTEILLLAGILTVSYAESRAVKMEWDEKELRFYKGMLIRRVITVPRSRVVGAVFTRSPVERLFRAAGVTLWVEGSGRKARGFSYKLYHKDSKTLYLALFGKTKQPVIRVSVPKICLSAAAQSSAITGWAVAVPVLHRAGKLFGVALSEILLLRVGTVAERFRAVFPPVLNMITLLLAVGYAISFVTALTRAVQWRMTAGKTVTVRAGLFTRRTLVLLPQKAVGVRLERPPLLYALRRARLSVISTGAERRKNDTVPLPTVDFRAPVPLPESGGVILRPPQTRRIARRFYRIPLFWLATVSAIAVSAGQLLDFFDRFAVFLTLPIFAIIAYYGQLCRLNFRRGCLIFGRDLTVRNSRGMALCETRLTVPPAGWRLTETPRDRRDGTCNVRLRPAGTSGATARVRRLNTDAVLENLENAGRTE